ATFRRRRGGVNRQPVSPGELTITVTERLGDWALPWNALVESLPIPSPFLRSWWLEGTAGRRPRFVLVIEGDNLLGGLALEEGRALGLPAFRLMGAGVLCPDHLDIVARPEHAQRVVGAVAGWMSRQGGRIFDLEGVVADSLLSLAVPRRARGEVIAVAPWLPEPVDFSRYLASRPRGFRSTLRK